MLRLVLNTRFAYVTEIRDQRIELVLEEYRIRFSMKDTKLGIICFY